MSPVALGASKGGGARVPLDDGAGLASPGAGPRHLAASAFQTPAFSRWLAGAGLLAETTIDSPQLPMLSGRSRRFGNANDVKNGQNKSGPWRVSAPKRQWAGRSIRPEGRTERRPESSS
jgi:hypothetical protein